MSKTSYKKMMNSPERFNSLDPKYRKFASGQSTMNDASMGRSISLVRESKDFDGKTIIVERRVVRVHSLCTERDYEVANNYNSKLLN